MLPPDKINRLPELEWIQSRIPKLDALVTFVADGAVHLPAVESAMRGHPARWYPKPGGHRVLILYEGGDYDASTFSVEREVWDHEHCKVCEASIPSMTLCFVTKRGPHIILCDQCYLKHVESQS
jgi:hypothetical protein